MNVITESANSDWGPFERPLFDDPSSRALARVGVVDVGSNSVRLVVFHGAARSPAYFYNEKIMCALGAGLADISPASFVAAVGYGLATCVFPWFLVLPALGFGVFGRVDSSMLQ